MKNSKSMEKHPYLEFENTKLWEVIENTINGLEENQDLELMTPREYVVGFICKQLKENGLLFID